MPLPPPPVAHAAAAPSKGPTCSQVTGQTVGRSETWRLVALPPRKGDYAKRRIVACRLADAPPIKVRILGLSENPGEFSGVPVLSYGVHGDLAVEAAPSSSSGGTITGWRMLDLSTGSVMPLPMSTSSQNDTVERKIRLAFSPGGAFAVAAWTVPTYPVAPDPGGTVQLYASGTRGELPPIVGLWPSLGDGTAADAGFYTQAPDGTLGRMRASGPVPRDGLVVDPKLRLRRIALARTRPAKGSPSSREVGERGRGLRVTVETTRRRGATRRSEVWVRDPESGSSGEVDTRAPIVPGSEDQVRLVAVAFDGAYVAARYLDAPDELRLRRLPVFKPRPPRFDIPYPAAAELPGRVALTNCRWLAIADGDRLRIWDPKPREVAIPGVHDLVSGLPQNTGSCTGLIASDATGTPIAVPLNPDIG